MGHRIAGIELERAPQERDRLVQLSPVGQDRSGVVVAVRLGGRHDVRLAEYRQGLVGAPHEEVDLAQVQQGLR